MKKYTICSNCEIHHYDNCEICFGFGLYESKDGGFYPIPAGEAITTKKFRGKLVTCPECGSTENGIPIKPNLPVGKFVGEPIPVFYNKEITATSIIIEMGIDTKMARYKIDENTTIRVDFTPTFVCDNIDEPSKIAGEEIKITIEYKEPLVI